jgi:uncharacterized membrane protein YkgB
MKKIIWFARVSIFVVYFWFGILKALGISPAEDLVHQLFRITLSSLTSFSFFLISFGLFECLIGILWLIPKLTHIAYYALVFHFMLILTPTIALPEVAWAQLFVPTFIGQYIIKNLLLLSCAMLIVSSYNLEKDSK